MIQASDDTDRRIGERRRHARQIIGLDRDVAVGDHDAAVARALGEIDEIADLQVRAVHARVDHELDVAIGIVGLQPAHDGDGRIGRGRDAEQQLIARMPLLAEGREVFVEMRLRSA
ncbi:glycosyl transferase, family 2- domain protein [Burkholderia pseudomallei MSHR7527]|nr:glycosyl transferase, family 2- domain protein [Burkholderia pseudomallei MSHR7527]